MNEHSRQPRPSIRLDARLSSVAQLIPQDAVVADIGTDHGYLMGYLYAAGIIKKGFACDINPLPLEKAKATLQSVGAQEHVSVRLSDGLFGLQQELFSHVVIAGMGGDLIFRILQDAPWCRERDVTYLLLPMTKGDHLRQKLWENGYDLLREKASIAGGFPYSVMEVRYTGNVYHPSKAEVLLGKLGGDPSPAAKAYGRKMQQMVKNKIEGLTKSGSDPQKLQEWKETLENFQIQTGDNINENTTSI